jgi:signal transduction histidine kinase
VDALRTAAWYVATAVGTRFGGLPAPAVDLALAVGMLIPMVGIHIANAAKLGDRFLAALVLSVVIAGSLVARRRAPLAAYLVGSAGLVVESLWLGPGFVTPYANLIGLYSLGYHASPQRARIGPIVLLPGILAYFSTEDDASPTAPVGVLFVWLLAWATGYSFARRREQMEANRRLMRREAVIDERVRIARELHDVIGHTVNAMLMQAGAGRMVLDSDPERTREMLASVERTGRNALAELDRVLGVLRSDDGPEPGLDDLDAVVQPLIDAGMTVHIDIDPAVQGLPRSLELSAYRIVQEGLTNALKHGRARSAEVVIRIRDGALLIEVHDDGRGPGSGYQPGRGLLGIAERVGVFGGTVEHGRGPGADRGGFTLKTVLEMPAPSESNEVTA